MKTKKQVNQTSPFPNVIMKTEKGSKEGGRKSVSINHFLEFEEISDYSLNLSLPEELIILLVEFPTIMLPHRREHLTEDV